MRHTFTRVLTFCFADRTNTPPFSSAALPLRLRLRETRICSPLGTGAARNQISDVAVIILSSSAEDVESTREARYVSPRHRRRRSTWLSPPVPLCPPAHSDPRPRRRRAFRAVTRSRRRAELRVGLAEARSGSPVFVRVTIYRSPRDDRRGCTPRWQCPGPSSLARRPPRAGSPFFSPAGRISRVAQCRTHRARAGARFHILNDVVFHLCETSLHPAFSHTSYYYCRGFFFGMFISMHTVPSGYV